MATVGDLLHVQSIVIQLLAKGSDQPTVSEVTDQAEAGTIAPYLVELGQARDVDVSSLNAVLNPSTEHGQGVADAIGSAANAIDPPRKYGMPYDAPLGLLALSWWIVDQIGAAARDVESGW